MKFLIDLPLHKYEHFIAVCDPTCREYAVLKNSIVIGPAGQRIVKLICNEEDVLKLLIACVMVCEELTGPIGKAIDRAHAAARLPGYVRKRVTELEMEVAELKVKRLKQKE
jgi:hypothetical protein